MKLPDALADAQSEIRAARDRRAAAVKDADRHKAALAKSLEGDARLDRNSATYKAAVSAGERVTAAAAEIEQLQERERDLLVAISPGRSQSGARGELEHDIKQPGGWLAAVAAQPVAMAAAGPGTLTTSDIGSVSDLGQPFIDRLSLASGLLASGPTILDITTSSVKLPRMTGQLAPAPITAELDPLPADDPPMATVEVTPPKYGRTLTVSLEAWRDARPAQLAAVESELVRSVATGFDAAAFGGAVGSAQPGLANIAGVAVVDAAGALTSLDPFLLAMGALRAAGAVPTAIYIAPQVWTRLSLLKKEAGSNEPLVSGDHSATDAAALAIAGVTAYPSRGLGGATAFVAQASELIVVRRSDIEIAVDPFYGFNEASIGIRVITRLYLLAGQPAAVAKITNLPTA